MQNNLSPLETAQQSANAAIRADFLANGLNEHIIRNLSVSVIEQNGRFLLSVPCNFMKLQLIDADERLFFNAFTDLGNRLKKCSSGTFHLKSQSPIECAAFNVSDLLNGLNQALASDNQIDMARLGRGK